MPAGRPHLYNPDVAEQITSRMAAGELVREICREPGMPAESTVRGWAANPDHPFAVPYARARLLQGHAIAESAVASAMAASPEDAAARRLHYDAQRWLAGKIAPRDYGDKTMHTDPDGGPLTIAVRTFFQPISEADKGGEP